MAVEPAIQDQSPQRSGMDERRQHILAAATKRFAEFGFGPTTVRQIADDVGLLSGSLYHHFDTKEDMLHEIVRQAVRQLEDVTRRIMSAPVDPEVRLTALIITYLEGVTSQYAAHNILYNERKFIRRGVDFAYVEESRTFTYGAWEQVLREGIEQGLFRPELEVAMVISTMMRLMNNGAEWKAVGNSSPLDQRAKWTLSDIIQFNLDFILRAVRPSGRVDDPIPREAADALSL